MSKHFGGYVFDIIMCQNQHVQRFQTLNQRCKYIIKQSIIVTVNTHYSFINKILRKLSFTVMHGYNP